MVICRRWGWRTIIEFVDAANNVKSYSVDNYYELKEFENFLFNNPCFGREGWRTEVYCKSDNRYYYYKLEDGKIITDGEVPPLERDKEKEAVDHPAHYTQGDIECIDAIKAATIGKTGIEAACVANVIKYLWRYEAKNGVEDCRKAKWYLERLIKEVAEREKNERA